MELEDKPLFAAQESLRIIADRIDIGLFKTDAAGKIDFVNPSACSILGFAPKEATRMKLPEQGSVIFGPAWSGIVSDHWRLALSGKEGEFECEVGSGRTVHVNYYPIRNGDYLGTVGIIRDVTTEQTVLRDLYRLKEEFRHDCII